MPDDILLSEFTPHPELVVPQHTIMRSKFVCLDAHNHLPAERFRTNPAELRQLLAEMDALNVGCIANLSGGWGENLRQNIATLDRAYPGRFVTLCNIDWQDALSAGWLERTLKQLEQDVKSGARGLKVFKELGLIYRDPQNLLIMPDDPRIASIWDKAGELGVPVLIHTADPTAFFKPLNGDNERWDELHRRPEWHFHDPKYPAFMDLIESLYRTIAVHPSTTFITAHVGCYPENLGFVGEMLERFPNMLTDMSARVAELGRVPYSAHHFFNTYADRILFGTDGANIAGFRVCFRFLETADEYFSYAPNAPFPCQGRWNIYGITLDDEVLRKVYWQNAAKVYGL
ncbi:MAG: amidohydrolase family protein [Anaerolineae bacterium]